MNRTGNFLNNRLKLRDPQYASLEILSKLVELVPLKKDVDLEKYAEIINKEFPIFKDFEREFVSYCFALATGVGKTRLMGAFIAYLYMEKGIKNFFVVAPNLTIYQKLIADFSNPDSPKYVFKGLSEFVHNPPRVINGDNYENFRQQTISDSDIVINVFNISKINSDVKKSRKAAEKHLPPRIKRLSEYLGQSYFDYLSNLDDLVILMDESHHYRADAGVKALNELKPVLGLEVTATPQVEKAKKSTKFKNVVYEYSLAYAIEDGYVKTPAVATRKDFDPKLYAMDELDKLKLEDGIRIHEETKVELELFTRDKKLTMVKPFVLVVAKDTTHAKMLLEEIKGDDFFNGYYKNKVLEVHSAQSGSEKEENIRRLLTLERLDNEIEIVIHVNMLKEGWDVTNLYTIIPLRTATSTTLREQTIGRGLRLPFGKRTGVDKVDRLTIVSHDKFQEIVDEANKEGSIIKQKNIIEIDPNEPYKKQTVVTSFSNQEKEFNDREKEIETIVDIDKKSKAKLELEADKEIVNVISSLNKEVKNINNMRTSDVKKLVIEKIKYKIESEPQMQLFGDDIVKEAESRYDSIINKFIGNIIEIPRIIVQPTGSVEVWFEDFDLDTRNLNYQPTSETIHIQTLTDGQIEYIDSRRGMVRHDSIENMLVSELLDYPEIDYQSNAELLYKLVLQAINKIKSYLPDEKDVLNVIGMRKTEIGRLIYSQMKEHFRQGTPQYEKPKVYPFTELRKWDFTKYANDDIFDYKETIEPTRDIPKKVFTGFIKSCHSMYKFDSKTEKDFSFILENSSHVIKWLRPASGQFNIYWSNNSKEYKPDFVVETANTIFLVETKKKKDITTEEVQGKAKAALTYCENATEFTINNGGKPWKYVLIPHDAVMLNMSFEFLVTEYEYKEI